MEVADIRFTPLNAWDDNLLDLSDVVEPGTSSYSPTALSCCYHYNNTITSVRLKSKQIQLVTL